MKSFSLLFSILAAAVSFGAEAPVEIAPALRGAVQPQLAAAPDGQLHVVFGVGNTVYTAASADARTFSPPVKVGELPKLALKLRRGPRIAATEGALLITAISHADGKIHLWSSADRGAAWRQGAPVNAAAGSAREGLHAMAAGGNTVAVAWLDDRNGGKELWSRVSADGGATWQQEAKVYASPEGHICECCHPSLAFGSGGKITAMWRNSLGGARDLWTASSTDGGHTWGSAGKLGTGTWKFNACPMDGGGLSDDGAALHTVWRRDRTVFAASPGAPEEKVAEGAAQPVVAAGGGRTFTAWEQGGQILFQTEGTASRPMGAGKAPAIVYSAQRHGVFLAWESEGKGMLGEFIPDGPAL